MGQRLEHAKLLYGALFDEVSRVLFVHDPMGINFDDNADEYEPEASTILPRLEGISSEEEAFDVVFQELFLWFDPDVVGPKLRHKELVAEIGAEWSRYKRQLPS